MTHASKLSPVFLVRDLEEALAYYRDVLGFSLAWTWGEPVHRAGVVLGEVEIQLEAAGLGAPPGPSVVYCQVTGVDRYDEACRARGVQLVFELADRPWGMRDFRVVDPSGNIITFGEPLARS